MNLEAFREALLAKKLELAEAGVVRPLQATMENNSRQGDMADQASGNNEVHIALKLRQTDAKILQAIEEALQRIEKGTYWHLPRLRRAHRRGPAARHPLDAGVHRLQGKAKSVKPTELVALLQECYRDRLALVERHKAVAVHVSNYDANNTYQYVINREETHLEWLGASLLDLGAPLPAESSGPVDHARPVQGRVEGGRRRGRARRRRVSREVASRA
jgi:hypothetical protein